MEIANMPDDIAREWAEKIIAKLRAENAPDLKDSTLRRLLLPCVAGIKCYEVAKYLKKYGYIATGRL